MEDIIIRINRAIRTWQKALKSQTHPKFKKRLGENVRALLREKKDLETEDTAS